MTRARRPSEQASVLATATTRLAALERDLPAVVDRLRDWAAGASSGGGGCAPGHVSDPTGERALAVDEWGMARQRLSQLIDRVHVAAADLEHIRRTVMDPAPPKAPEHRGLVACANLHGCPDDAWATKAGRCEACYRYNRRVGHDRRLSRRGSEDA